MTPTTATQPLTPTIRPQRRRRSAAILISALVCMSVVIAILGVMLQGSLRARRQLHVERERRQTELLVDAGLDRAALRLSREPDYRGEMWHIPASELSSLGDAVITIEAKRDSDTAPWQVSVIAEYPLGSERSTQRTRTFTVQQSQPLL